MLKQFLEKVTSFLKLEEPLLVNEKGEAELSLEPGLEILLRENPAPGITLAMTLAPMPEKKDDFVYDALCSNLFGIRTGESFLGCNREGSMITLTRFLSFDVSNREFMEALEEFANYAETWRKICVDYQRV